MLRTVGELREFLRRYTDDMPISGFDGRYEVWNYGISIEESNSGAENLFLDDDSCVVVDKVLFIR